MNDDQLWLGGYKLVSRRGRGDGGADGCILCFVIDRSGQQALFLERLWHILHANISASFVAFGTNGQAQARWLLFLIAAMIIVNTL